MPEAITALYQYLKQQGRIDVGMVAAGLVPEELGRDALDECVGMIDTPLGKRAEKYRSAFAERKPGEALVLAVLGLEFARLGEQEAQRRFAGPLREGPFFETYSELLDQLDDDELLPLRSFKQMFDGLHYGQHVVRPLGLSPELQMILWRMPPESNPRIAVNSWEMTPRAEHRGRLYEERYWGKPFNRVEFDKRLPEGQNLTTYWRKPGTPETLALQAFHPIERFEAVRTERDGFLAMMFEELPPLSEKDIERGFVQTRLFHSEFVRDNQAFRHSDGTILRYEVNQYEDRLKTDLKTSNIKASVHRKLFRVDGLVGIDHWALLLQEHYPKNELAQEFLDGR